MRIGRQIVRVPAESGQAGPLDRGQAEDGVAWLEQLQAESKAEIADHEHLEQVALASLARAQPEQKRQKNEGEEGDLVQLRGVARDAVAEIDRPRQVGG